MAAQQQEFAPLSYLGSIDRWFQDDYAVVSEGALAKHTVIDPQGDFWIWKEPKRGRESMVWSELLSSFIVGDLLEWDVQSAAVAKRGDGYVCMLRYFYDPSKTALVHGAEHLCAMDAEYDLQRQTRHTWSLVEGYCKSNLMDQQSFEAHIDWWGQTFAMDGLICNGDRHGHNWGVLRDHGDLFDRYYAPRFDHNNCLGFMLGEKKLKNLAASKQLDTHAKGFVEKGENHMRWAEPSKGKPLRSEFLTEFLNHYPGQRKQFELAAELDLSPIESFMGEMMRVSADFGEYALSEVCCQYILSILRHSKEQLKSILRGQGVSTGYAN